MKIKVIIRSMHSYPLNALGGDDIRDVFAFSANKDEYLLNPIQEKSLYRLDLIKVTGPDKQKLSEGRK